jgi:hypothetical protein
MTGTQVLVLALLVAAFAAGWLARGSDLEEVEGRGARRRRRRMRRGEAEATAGQPTAEATVATPVTAPLVDTARWAPLEAEAPAPAPGPAPGTLPQPRDVAVRALDLASTAYEHAVDRWLDEGVAITPAGRATLGELDRAIRRLDLAVGRLDAAPGDHEREAGEARIALAALRDASELLGGYRDGRAIDAATDRQLRELEDEVAQARQALTGELP